MGGFAPKGHAKLNPASPAAFAICDRCGFMYNHRDLRWDQQYRGKYLQKTGFLVCDSCYDVPNPTLRPIVLPADPVPILNPRAEPMHCHTFQPRADATIRARADIGYRHYPPVDAFRDVTVDSGSVCDDRIGTKAPLKPPGPFPFPPEPEPTPPPIVLPPVDASADTTTVDAMFPTVDAYNPYPPLVGELARADTMLVTADNMRNSTDSVPVYPVRPPLSISDAFADTIQASADATGTTTDVSVIVYAQAGYVAVTDTTKVLTDDMINTIDSYPDYDYAADLTALGADNTAVRSDSQTLSG